MVSILLKSIFFCEKRQLNDELQQAKNNPTFCWIHNYHTSYPTVYNNSLGGGVRWLWYGSMILCQMQFQVSFFLPWISLFFQYLVSYFYMLGIYKVSFFNFFGIYLVSNRYQMDFRYSVAPLDIVRDFVESNTLG